MVDYVLALGGITVGSHLNAMLYMLEIVQLVSYINHFWKRDKPLLRYVVVLCFLIDTLSTAAIFAWVLMYDVIHWGDIPYLDKQDWPIPTYLFCTTIVAALVQSFLISRYYVLSSQRIVSLLLGVFVLTAFVGGILIGILTLFFVTYTDRGRVILLSIIWLISTSLADVLIAFCLVLTLSRASSRTTLRTTRTLLFRLITAAIQSGTVTTIFALLVLITFVTRPLTNDTAYFSLYLGRIYTLTMLFNLNLRRGLDSSFCTCGRTALGISLAGGTVTGVPAGQVLHASRSTDALGRTGSDNPAAVYRLSGSHVHQARSKLYPDVEDAATVHESEEHRDCKDVIRV